MDLTERVVMISGAAEGIGACCASRFLEKSAKVSTCDLTASKRVAGPNVLHMTGDITDPSFQQKWIQRTVEVFGRIDVLVNNAGIGAYLPATLTPSEVARRIFDVNVFAPMALVGAVVPHMQRQNGGVVVNVGSVGAWASLPWATMYCSSKNAMHSLSEGLYRELAPEGIHVVTVAPGIVQTGFREHVIAGHVPGGVQNIRGAIKPEDLAAAIVRAVEKKRRWVIQPWTVTPFAILNYLFPAIVDRYCASKWKGLPKDYPGTIAEPGVLPSNLNADI